MVDDICSEDHALEMDEDDELSDHRKRFYIPKDTVYLNGNSLGLLSKDAEESLQEVTEEWKELAIKGWTEGEPPWFFMAETLGENIADMVGAKPEEVVATGTTTVNIHSLVTTLYEPTPGKDKILADELNFPTDIYALRGDIELKGLDPNEKLVLVPSEDGKTLDEERIVSMMTEDTALAHLPSVLYKSGQLLDIDYLTKKAHEKDIIIGFDCSHSAGVIPHQLHDRGVDYAVWCSYKYLNGGPGSSAFLYLNERYFDKEPKLKGWFGYEKEKQFELNLDFIHQKSAGGWQISSPAILNSAPLLGSIETINKAGIENIRSKSKKITAYFIRLVKESLCDEPYSFQIGSPLDDDRRGGHVALHHEKAKAISQILRDNDYVTDFRPPDTIRIAFSPLYNTYHEAWLTFKKLKDIIDRSEHLNAGDKKSLVT